MHIKTHKHMVGFHLRRFSNDVGFHHHTACLCARFQLGLLIVFAFCHVSLSVFSYAFWPVSCCLFRIQKRAPFVHLPTQLCFCQILRDKYLVSFVVQIGTTGYLCVMRWPLVAWSDPVAAILHPYLIFVCTVFRFAFLRKGAQHFPGVKWPLTFHCEDDSRFRVCNVVF